jgi:hypothetical protein
MENIKKHWPYKTDLKDRFCIYFSDHYSGYFDLCFHFSDLKIQLFYSTCTNTIDELINWIKEIENDKEFVYFNIDEEGPHVKIILERRDKLNNDLYEIKIIREGQPYYEYEFKKIISKKIFTEKILYALNKLANEKQWGKNNCYGKMIIEELKFYMEKYKITENKECINCREKICE